MRIITLTTFILCASSCIDNHNDVSYELVKMLEKTEVNCDFIKKSKYSKGYWVRNELDGWGLLVISKNSEPNFYTLSLMAHGHEMATETRIIDCE